MFSHPDEVLLKNRKSAGAPRVLITRDSAGGRGAIYTADGGFVDSIDAASGTVGLILDRTSFFAQAGGQVADSGRLMACGDGEPSQFDVSSVQSFGGYVLHVGSLSSGSITTGNELQCAVDTEQRLLVSKSHTLTHVINLALHQVLGDGVSQKGSLVDADKARFDFSHRKAMTTAQLKDVETRVRSMVSNSLPVHIETVPLDKAKEINNLRAVFGERYPDPVRVVSIGPTVPELLADPTNDEWEAYSIELCGGTHIPTTDVMAQFALVEESAVAKGVRRVVGVTGVAAASAIRKGEELSAKMAALQADATDAEAVATQRSATKALKLEIDEVTISAHLKAELREALSVREKALAQAMKSAANAEANKAAAAALDEAQLAKAGGQRYVVLELKDVNAKAMQPLVQSVVKQTGLATFAMAVDADAGKVACMAAVPEADVGALAANKWLSAVLEKIEGRGGGKPTSAQGSGSAVDKVPEAIEKARDLAAAALS